MRKLSKKLRSRKGEGFAELLVAVLVVAFGCALIASMYAASMSLNLKAKEEDDKYYDALSDMETMQNKKEHETEIRVFDKDEHGQETEEFNVGVREFGNDQYSSYRD